MGLARGGKKRNRKKREREHRPERKRQQKKKEMDLAFPVDLINNGTWRDGWLDLPLPYEQ